MHFGHKVVKFNKCILEKLDHHWVDPDRFLFKKTTTDQSLVAGGAMQLVAAASEPKFAAAAAASSQDPKFAHFSPLAVSTTGSSHETHQQNGKICGNSAAESFWIASKPFFHLHSLFDDSSCSGSFPCCWSMIHNDSQINMSMVG